MDLVLPADSAGGGKGGEAESGGSKRAIAIGQGDQALNGAVNCPVCMEELIVEWGRLGRSGGPWGDGDTRSGKKLR
jgi:hypothetical protein